MTRRAVLLLAMVGLFVALVFGGGFVVGLKSAPAAVACPSFQMCAITSGRAL